MSADYAKWLDNIRYTDDLDGGGRALAPVFQAALKGRKFKRCLEWCAGPAWIGFWLLETGVVEELVTVDINPKATEMVEATAAASGYPVTSYTSDNLREVPKHESFDLVVSNPPNYCNIQPSHPMGYLRDDLRPSDLDWKAHRDFYREIGGHLNKGAEIWISEVEPFKTQVYVGGHLYEQRFTLPIIAFLDMITDGGLLLEKVSPFKFGAMQMALLKSRIR